MSGQFPSAQYPQMQEPEEPMEQEQPFDFQTALQTYAQLVKQMDFNGDGVIDEKDFAILKKRGMAR